MKYEIVRTDKFEEQLRDSIFYIANDSGDIDIALNYLDKIENAVIMLEDCLYSGSTPRYSVLRKQGYKVLIVERHLIFYKVVGERVILYAIVDGRREYKNLI